MILKYFLLGYFLIDSVQCYALTENQIKEEIKFLSQTIDGIKPSRLRTYLLADLKKALPKQPDINCTADADLKVTPNCTCIDYSCARSHNKRSRIQRSCEDYCCRRSELVKKSLSAAVDESSNWRKLNDCQITFSENLDSYTTYGLAQIYQPKTKRTICLGTLIHPQIVITTLDCAATQTNKRIQIKVRETVDKYQYQYQIRNVTKRILPENYAELLGKFGFNIALLVLNKEIELNNQIRTTCLATSTHPTTPPIKCFVTSIENKNGRMLDQKQEVLIRNMETCYSKFKQIKNPIPKNSLCVQPKKYWELDSSNITLHGAPLVCIYKNQKNEHYFVQQNGMLTWSGVGDLSSLDSSYLFTNITEFKNWIDKNVKSLEL